MPTSNKQQLETEILNAVRRHEVAGHTTFEKSAQLGMEILGKYSKVPDSLMRTVVREKKSFLSRLVAVFGK